MLPTVMLLGLLFVIAACSSGSKPKASNLDDSIDNSETNLESSAPLQLLATETGGVIVIDDGGSNDVMGDGQNDLTRLEGDNFLTEDVFEVGWSWDEPTTIKGGNASNGCAMFDTDGDGNINYSFCVEVSFTEADGYFITDSGTGEDSVKDFPAWIECSDGKDDRCTHPNRLADPYTDPPINAICMLMEANTDPFPPVIPPGEEDPDPANGTPGGAGDDYPIDLTVVCEIDVSGDEPLIPTGAKFINVCSYPSAGNDGNNNPFDCVVTPGSGFLTIVKITDVTSATPFTFNASEASTNGSNSWDITVVDDGSGTGSGIGSVQGIPYLPTTTLDLNEIVPALWELDSASCEIQTNPVTPTGTNNVTGVNDVTILPGLETICTFTNSLAEAAPVPLTLTKVVNNDNGGSADPGDWTLTAQLTATDHPTHPSSPECLINEISGSGSFTSNVSQSDHFNCHYIISESVISGYQDLGWVCTGDVVYVPNPIPSIPSTIIAKVTGSGPNECRIINVAQQAYITVTKVVNNDHGGSASPDDFNLTLDGNPTTSGTQIPVNPGTYTAGETLLSGYTFNGFSGDCDENGATTVALGESKTCTLTNSDQQAYIIVEKVVDNTNGGNAQPDDFNLTLNGNATTSGTQIAYIIVEKVVDNTNGGNAQPDDFNLTLW